MKKIICILVLSLFTMPCMANIKLNGKVVGEIIKKYVPAEYVSATVTKYNEIDKRYFVGFPAQKLWNVCAAAGWDITQPQDKGQCELFVKALIRASYSQYYEVCEKKVPDGVGRCIEVFEDIEVQWAQAQNLAQEYAKVKYNDDIRCKNAVRESGNDDYIQCTSYDKKNFYEFRFDDAQESNYLKNAFIRREFGRGLCIIYGGKPNDIGDESKAELAQVNAIINLPENLASGCSIAKCDTLGSKVKKWGYTTSKPKNRNTCIISYNGMSTIESVNYVAKFDGKTFSVYFGEDKIKSWPAVSGRGRFPTDSRPTECQTPKYQACEEVGPTPAGTYYISQNEIQYADNIEVGNFNSNSLVANTSRTSWGDARVALVPDKSTNTYGRGSLYVHGGKYKGSSGCIDLTSNVRDFVEWFGKQTDFVKLKVIVDYGYVPEICGVKCSGPSCSNCTCPREINSETHETSCSYL